MMRASRALPILIGAALLGLAAPAVARAPRAAAALVARHLTTFSLAPAPSDLTLAEVRFPRSGRQALKGADLRLAPSGPLGADYLVLGAVLHPGRGGARALVLLVNRPTALLDPARVVLRLRSAGTLGPARPRSSANVLARSSSSPRAAVCDLPLGGKPLAAGGVRTLSAKGAALPGFSAAWALAAAYDAACGLTYPATFEQAIQGAAEPGGGCGAGASRQGTLCCPRNAMCAPLPGPPPEPSPEPRPAPPPEPKPVPPPEPPHCPVCNPKPGYACPLAGQPKVCPALAPASARSLAAPAAH
ncbi:MAG: hypothetical protein ACYDC2_00385 [Solirubrobacteraceae bacterium]